MADQVELWLPSAHGHAQVIALLFHFLTFHGESRPAEERFQVELNVIFLAGRRIDRSIKRIVRPMMEFKSFRSARVTRQGIEPMRRIKKGLIVPGDNQALSIAGQFYSLAA
jgi:hypothetical protein